MQSSKEEQKGIRKAFSNQCKEIEENIKMRKTSNLFKKTRDIKATFHAKMVSIKDRNGMDLKKQKILRRGGKNTQVQFSSVAESCPTLQPHESQHARAPCPSPTPEFTVTYIRRVSDAIQPSHPRSSPSPPAPNLSQHQSLFQ